MAPRTRKLPTLSWADVCARRMERHGLLAPLTDSQPAEVAAAICGAQAQVQAAAEWSVGLRLANATSGDVRNALWADRRLVRTYGPRGTVHLVASVDLPMWTAALSAVPYSPGGLPPGVQFSAEQAEAVIDSIADALLDAELTTDELTDAVMARVGDWAGDKVMPAFGGAWPRWRQVLPLAGMRGVLCFGPNRGRKVTYTHPRRWLPGFRCADTRPALAELVRRYLHAYGPATSRQFAQWLAAPREWAVTLFDSLQSDLVQAEFNGVPTWLNAGDHELPSGGPEGVRLLPYFDSYVIGCHPRELVFRDAAFRRALNTTGQAGTRPTVLINGMVAGIWHHQRRSGRELAVTVEPFDQLTRQRRRQLEIEAERLGAFLGTASSLTIGPVSVSSHR